MHIELLHTERQITEILKSFPEMTLANGFGGEGDTFVTKLLLIPKFLI